MDDLVSEFLSETRDNLAEVEVDLAVLEHAGDDKAALGRVYKRFHTLIGTCGFLGLSRLEAVAREVETLLVALRDGQVASTPARWQGVREAIGAIRAMADTVEREGSEGADPHEALAARLHGLLQEDTKPDPTPDELPQTEDEALLGDFLLEADEHLQSAETAITTLRAEATNTRAAGRLYRAFHSLRAACQFFAFEQIEMLSKAAEEVLLPYRDASGPMSAATLDALLPLLPQLREILARVRSTGLEGTQDLTGLLEALRLPAPVSPPAPATTPAPPPPPVTAEQTSLVAEFLGESREALDQVDSDLVALEQTPGDSTLLARVFRCFHTLKGSCGFLGFPALQEVTHAGETLLGRLRDGQLVMDAQISSALLALVDRIRYALARIEEKGNEQGLTNEDLVVRLTRLSLGEHMAPVALAPAPAPVPVAAEAPDTVLRVDVNALDRLMTLVSELVLARNQILQRVEGRDDLAEATQHLDRITSELQEGVMKTRLQAIGTIWTKMPRIVRDVAKQCGKEIRLELEGRETELDRSLLEAIKDPLQHIVRNAIDHGIESSEERKSRHKPPAGLVSMKAYHKSGQVHIEISDDGRGIDTDRVKAKAIEKGLITLDQGARMTPRELIELIMLPGFSTAEKITNVSGRGVGMDVVKSNIEKIGGVVEIGSVPHQGSTFKIKIPLTLAILPALLIRTQGQRFAVPQVNLVEVIRVEGSHGIEWVHSAPVYRLRDSLLPLVGLGHELRLEESTIPTRDSFSIIVLHADVQRFGLVVHEVLDPEDIVVKPLGKLLSGISVYAGAAILGDGDPVLILDVLGLAQRAHVLSELEQVHPQAPETPPPPDQEEFLIFKNHEGERFVMPLSQVVRLERFSASRIEKSGAQSVVQYQHEILPLVELDTVLARPVPAHGTDDLHCVVCRIQGRSLGLLVEQIVDIVEDSPEVKGKATRPGVICRAVIGERVVEILDTGEVVRLAYPVR